MRYLGAFSVTWLHTIEHGNTTKFVAMELPRPTGKVPAMKKTLTDRTLKTLKPAAKPYEVMDAVVRSFGVRIMPSGVKSFILLRRFPGSKNPARRALGAYPDTSLADARERAREWNALAAKGIDPAIEENRQRQALIEAEKTAAKVHFRSRL